MRQSSKTLTNVYVSLVRSWFLDNYLEFWGKYLTRKKVRLRKDNWSMNRLIVVIEIKDFFRCIYLRVRALTFFHKTVRVCYVYSNFKISFTCRITVIFGTLKDGSLLINTLASNICFSYRNMFQNGVDALSKIGDAFLSKSSSFLSSSDYPIMFKFC